MLDLCTESHGRFVENDNGCRGRDPSRTARVARETSHTFDRLAVFGRIPSLSRTTGAWIGTTLVFEDTRASVSVGDSGVHVTTDELARSLHADPERRCG